MFERWGFEWGGRWLVPDPMHFELTPPVAPPR
ncbi:MAG: M15 family metallopeptidase [Actinomycetota bacterium]